MISETRVELHVDGHDRASGLVGRSRLRGGVPGRGLARLVNSSVTVTEEEIRAGMRLVMERHHTLIEGAAAVAVAGDLKEKDRFRGRRVVIVLCGANISLERLREAIA